MRRRRIVPPEMNTANITNLTVSTNNLIQNQTVSIPTQMPLDTTNEIRIERTTVIENKAFRIALSVRAL